MKVTKIFVVDDEPLFFDGLRMVLEKLPSLKLVGTATSGRDALAQLKKMVPQVFTAILVVETPLLNLLYNVYTPVEFVILFCMFAPKYQGRTNRIVMKSSAILYGAVCLYFGARAGMKERFLNELVCINNLFYMLWILLLLKQEYGEDHRIIEKSNPFAWYFLAFVVYAPSTVIVFALYYYIRNPANGILMNLWIIQSVCNILLYLFFATGLLIRKHIQYNL